MDQIEEIKRANIRLIQNPKSLMHVYSAIEQSVSPVMITDRKGIINYTNPAFNKLTGYSSEELTGVSPAILKSGHHSKGFYKDLWRTILSGNSWQSEVCNKNKNGDLYWEYQCISPIKDNSGEITNFLAIRLDDTKRKEYEIELKQLTENLQKSNSNLENYTKAVEIANMQLKNFSGQLQSRFEELKESHLETINRLAIAAEFKDDDTGEHIIRMSRYSSVIAKTLGYSEDQVENILCATPMHDIGKVGIPDKIMHKNGKLDYHEFEQIKEHPIIGAKILANSQSPLVNLAETIALSHHEKWNGTGYPLGLSGKDIPEAGQITALADCFDALTSRRPYKDPYPIDIAKEIIVKEKGESFDPEIVDAFLGSIEDIKIIKSEVDGITQPSSANFQLSERDRLNTKGTC
jgi:PAS domain S-box-containing protein